MYIVRETREEGYNVWTVGHYAPPGSVRPAKSRYESDRNIESEWVPYYDANSREDADAFCNYMNGGTGLDRETLANTVTALSELLLRGTL